MNEQALQDAYELFTAEGYQGSLQDFVNLINSNPNALQDSYDLFKEEGYAKPIEDYQVLVGVKKKTVGHLLQRLVYWSHQLFHRSLRQSNPKVSNSF